MTKTTMYCDRCGKKIKKKKSFRLSIFDENSWLTPQVCASCDMCDACYRIVLETVRNVLKPLKSDLQEYINEQMEDGEFEKEFNKQRKRFEKIMAKIRKQK